MSIFKAFSHAIVPGWTLIEQVRSTEVGKAYLDYGSLDVIVDDVGSASVNVPNADGIENDLLIYVKPEQLPSTKAKELLGGCMVMDTDGTAYDITNVGVGKNQQTGRIEHVELLLRETEVVNG